MALSGAGATACYLTAYQPMLRSTAAMNRLSAEEEHHNWQRYEAVLEAAAKADPLSAQAWQLLAGFDFQRIGISGDRGTQREQFDQVLGRMLQLRPQSSGAYRQAGQWLLELFRRKGDPADARLAIEYFGRAVDLYPNSALRTPNWHWLWPRRANESRRGRKPIEHTSSMRPCRIPIKNCRPTSTGNCAPSRIRRPRTARPDKPPERAATRVDAARAEALQFRSRPQHPEPIPGD